MVFEATFICGAAFFVFTAFILTMRIRRRILARSTPPPQPVFDMTEIRSLLDGGKITQEEHDRLRGVLLKQRSEAIPPGRRGFEISPLATPPETTGTPAESGIHQA